MGCLQGFIWPGIQPYSREVSGRSCAILCDLARIVSAGYCLHFPEVLKKFGACCPQNWGLWGLLNLPKMKMKMKMKMKGYDFATRFATVLLPNLLSFCCSFAMWFAIVLLHVLLDSNVWTDHKKRRNSLTANTLHGLCQSVVKDCLMTRLCEVPPQLPVCECRSRTCLSELAEKFATRFAASLLPTLLEVCCNFAAGFATRFAMILLHVCYTFCCSGSAHTHLFRSFADYGFPTMHTLTSVPLLSQNVCDNVTLRNTSRRRRRFKGRADDSRRNHQRLADKSATVSETGISGGTC